MLHGPGRSLTVVALSVLGCTPPEPSGPRVVEPPAIVAPDDPRVHLVRRLTVSTDVPTHAIVVLDDGERRREIAFAAPATAHDLPLLGLRPDTTVAVEIRLLGAGGEAHETVSFEVGPLEVVVPRAEVRVQDAGAREPGLVLVPPSAEDVGLTSLVAYDADGVPVYVAEVDAELRALGTFHGPVGDLRVSALMGDVLVELDLFGQLLRTVLPATVGVRGFHHELRREADGGLLALTKESVEVRDYPVDPTDLSVTADVSIEADVVIGLDPAGAERARWRLAELLDPHRIGYDATDRAPGGDLIWSHANAVEVDPRDDTLLISARHQDAVVKLTRDGEVRWILANPDGWGEAWRDRLLTPVGEPFLWPFHQHAPMATADGIVLFDNGNNARTTPYSRDPHPDGDWSRVVAYTIDEDAMEVRQAWSFVGDGQGTLFSTVVGNADVLPKTGHVLATYAWLTDEGGVANVARGRGRKSVRVIEIAPNATGAAAPVWDLSLFSDFDEAPLGWGIDRAVPVPSLYGALAVER